MASLKHDVWRDKEGLTSLIFSGDLGEEGRSVLEDGSIIIYSFWADSHYDAMSKYYEFMAWGKYQTEFEVDKTPYDLLQLRAMLSRNKTIEQIERSELGIPKNGSPLVTKVHELRKKRIGDFTTEDLRLLIGQNQSLEILIPKAILELRANILAEGDFYEGDLLNSVLDSDNNYWLKNKDQWSEVLDLCRKHQHIFSSDNTYRQINKSIEKFIEINAN